eukprot:COSAG02_NODE_185_length_30442_cov_59.370168_2_plen_253_part_00
MHRTKLYPGAERMRVPLLLLLLLLLLLGRVSGRPTGLTGATLCCGTTCRRLHEESPRAWAHRDKKVKWTQTLPRVSPRPCLRFCCPLVWLTPRSPTRGRRSSPGCGIRGTGCQTRDGPCTPSRARPMGAAAAVSGAEQAVVVPQTMARAPRSLGEQRHAPRSTASARACSAARQPRTLSSHRAEIGPETARLGAPSGSSTSTAPSACFTKLCAENKLSNRVHQELTGKTSGSTVNRLRGFFFRASLLILPLF